MKLCGRQWLRVWLPTLLLTLNSSIVYSQNMAQNSSPRPSRDINAVLAAHDKELLRIPDVAGVYVSTNKDGRTLCSKVILARKNPESERKIPRVIEGYPVVTEVTRDDRALGRP
jgi:hypothetical protein